MFKSHMFVSILIVGISFQNLYADDATNSALQETLNCLKNQNCQSSKTNAGKAADLKALEAVGGNADDKQSLFNISADIMSVLYQESGGDPDKIEAIMQKAQTDPEGFYNSLPPEIQNKIKSIASSIEKK